MRFLYYPLSSFVVLEKNEDSKDLLESLIFQMMRCSVIKLFNDGAQQKYSVKCGDFEI